MLSKRITAKINFLRAKSRLKRVLYGVQNGRCYYCGCECFIDVEITNRKLFTLDHIIPKSRGGKDHSWNLVGACLYCNQQKGRKKISEYLPKR